MLFHCSYPKFPIGEGNCCYIHLTVGSERPLDCLAISLLKNGYANFLKENVCIIAISVVI